jgi:Raf kinase inhibitor-like YbhB/YbcL family protein
MASAWALAAACSSSSNSSDHADGGSDASTSAQDAAQNATDAAQDSATGSPDADAGGFVLTSPAFAEGQPIPAVNTCAGANTSPELDWTAGPSGTLSYALVVTDLSTGGTNDAGVTTSPIIHWVIWDMPPSTRQLPAMLPTDPTLTTPVMAKQVDLRTNPDAAVAMNGFFGPCPRGNTHHYQFAIHAMNVATLSGVTTTSTSVEAKAAVLASSIAEADLTGTSNAAPPPADASASDAGGQ